MPTTVTAAVANRLRDEILSGRLAPGDRLRQAHVAASFGVSTTPVREAFAALEREGLIESHPHRGVVVFEPSGRDLHEYYEIRIPLEAFATEKAVPNLSDGDLARLQSLRERLAASNRKADWKLSTELNDEFHFTIYRAARRPQLLQMITELRASSRAYVAIVPRLVDRMEESDREHEAIYRACAEKRPKQAAKAMVRHLQHSVDIVSASLEDGQSS